jgi:hypothetical protein
MYLDNGGIDTGLIETGEINEGVRGISVSVS